MLTEKVEGLSRVYALQNAVQFNGKANTKAVIGKVIAALKNEGVKPGEIIKIVEQIVESINNMTLDEQREMLQRLAPELMKKEKKERDYSLPSLPHAEKGRVITRFPPEPNGYLHIGHAKAAIIDHEYARLYDGVFILRFDDTNPENANLEFYDAQREDLHWLGLEWDKEYNTSDNIETHYKLALQLIEQGDAYICTCKPDRIKEYRFTGKNCDCRDKSPGEIKDKWRELIVSGEPEDGVLRLRGDMKSGNTAMRDPTLFRIVESEHPLKGTKYRMWPTYDFAGAVEDSLSGVTHPFRTKEYELRDEVYFYILSLLNLRKPYLMEFARLSIEGMPVSKRRIKPLIDKGLVTGYDDVRLPTLRGLKRRGITPEAIKQFVFTQGISKVESEVTFSLVESINKKILDPVAKRFFFVPDPVKLVVNDMPNRVINLRFHPTVDLGERSITVNNIFYIPRMDADKLREGEVFRLKDLANIKVLNKKTKEIKGEYAGDKLIHDTCKIQWTTEKFIPLKIIVPGLLFINDEYNPDSLHEINGYAEEEVKHLGDGEIVQFERVGFVRIEHDKKGMIGILSHK
ncbi:MAG: glutamate--tRNA ligase [Candidatus Thermoplasmatota archaeon]